MAITAITSRGFGGGSSKSSGTTLGINAWNTISGISPPNQNDVVILSIALDNTQTTDGQTSEVSSIDDPRSNTWTKLGEYCNGQGGAASGATVSVWKTKATTAYQQNDAITVNFANTITAKAGRFQCFTVGSGNDIQLAGTLQTRADDGADPGSMSTSSLSSKEYLHFRASAREGTSTNGTASTNFTRIVSVAGTSGGGGASNMSAWAEYRINTTTGETSDPTVASADTASVFMALEETGGTSAISGSSDPAFTTSGTLAGSGALAGSSSPAFTGSGFLQGFAPVAGAISVDFSTSGTALAVAVASGTADVVFTSSGLLAGAGALSGTADVAFSTSGALAGSGALSGALSVAFSASAVIFGLAPVSGSVDAAFTASALLLGSGALQGTSDPAFTTSGALIAGVAISGVSSLAFTTAGNLTVAPLMVGSTSLAFSALGRLSFTVVIQPVVIPGATLVTAALPPSAQIGAAAVPSGQLIEVPPPPTA